MGLNDGNGLNAVIGLSVSYFDSRMLKNDFNNIFDILNKIQI